MRKRYIIIFILLFFSQNSFSQGKGLLTGKVIFDNDAVPFVSVAIYKDNEIITGTYTDFDGKYTIPLQEGGYIVEATDAVLLISNKIKIEINANETVSLDIQLSEARYDFVTAIDTINVNAFELKEIDEKLKVAIDNHIKMAKRKFIFPNKKRNIIVVELDDIPYYYYDLEHIDINDIKSKHKQFKEKGFSGSYEACINFIRSNNRSKIIGLSNSKKRFYYKYKDWDIFLKTHIEDLEFPFVDGVKNFQYQIKYEKIKINKNGRYEMSHKKVRKYFEYEPALHYKRHEDYYTNYYISEREVKSVTTKSKCIFKDY